MWLGSMKHNTSKILEFKSTREPVKVLGIFLGYNQDRIIAENFLNRIRKMKTKLHLWLLSDLTLYDKSLLAKTLGVSQLVCFRFQMQLSKLSKQSFSLCYGRTKKIK